MEVVGCPGSHMAARDAGCHLQESLKEERDKQRNKGARGEGRAGFPGEPRANRRSGEQEGVSAPGGGILVVLGGRYPLPGDCTKAEKPRKARRAW